MSVTFYLMLIGFMLPVEGTRFLQILQIKKEEDFSMLVSHLSMNVSLLKFCICHFAEKVGLCGG